MPAVGMITKVLFSKKVLEPLLLTIPTIVQTARNVYDAALSVASRAMQTSLASFLNPGAAG